MSTPLLLSLPAEETELIEEVQQKLSPYATIHEAPRSYNAAEVLLILDYVKDGVGIAAGAASLLKTLLDLRKDHGKKVKVGRPGVPLEELDEAALRQQLDIGHEDKPVE